MAKEISVGGGGGGSWGDERIKIPPAVGYVPGLSNIIDAGRNAIESGADKVKGEFDGTFNFIQWIQSNWQLVIVGVVALLVLLKD